MAIRLPEKLKNHLRKKKFRVLKTKAERSWSEMNGRYVRVYTEKPLMEDDYLLFVSKMQGKYSVDSIQLPLFATTIQVDMAISQMRNSQETLGSVMDKAFKEYANRESEIECGR